MIVCLLRRWKPLHAKGLKITRGLIIGRRMLQPEATTASFIRMTIKYYSIAEMQIKELREQESS